LEDEVNQVTTLFFATLRDRAGVKSVELQIPPKTNVSQLKSILTNKYPALADIIGHMLVAINHEYVFDDDIIPDYAEIGLFPPVSGG
jgi:molybdopterin converting factor subunit 1